MMLNVSSTLSPSRNKDTRTQVREQLEKELGGVSPSQTKSQLVSLTYVWMWKSILLQITCNIPLVGAVRDDTGPAHSLLFWSERLYF